MQFKIFTISAVASQDATADLNSFLRGHKVMCVEKFFDPARGVLTFVVEYLENAVPQRHPDDVKASQKVDYKKTLSPTAFDRFTKLRGARKLVAGANEIPCFSVFSDRDLAAIASLENIDEASVMSIPGIGQARMDKYGYEVLKLAFPESDQDAEDDVATEPEQL